MSEATPVDEGLILLHEEGRLYTNQTGGVMCNHPEARGFFAPVPVPNTIKELMCCQYLSEGDQEDPLWQKVTLAFAEAKCPFVPLHGEEAWLTGLISTDQGIRLAILTWPNCD